MSLDSFLMERREYKDARTGRVVWQLTDGEFECFAPYMEKLAWSIRDRFIFFMCNKLGSWQPYSLELETGNAQQLFEVENQNSRSLCYSPAGNEIYFAHAGKLMAVEPESLRARTAIDFGEIRDREGSLNFNNPGVVLSGDGTLAAFKAVTPDGYSAIMTVRTDGSNECRTHRIPRQEISPGHIQFNPADNSLISFCSKDRQNDPNEEPFLRAREYRFDLTCGELHPLVLMPPGWRATHCIWGRSGDRIYAHRKHVPDWIPTALISVNRRGEDLLVHYETSAHKLGHSQPSPDENWIVSDSQDPDENILLLVHTERDEQHFLCWPNMSINSDREDKRSSNLPPYTDRHTHPGFSYTGKYCHYTSDESGRSQIYAVPIEDITV